MWLWNSGPLRSVVIFPTVVTVVVVVACYPVMGHTALYLLFAGHVGPLIALIYGVVGRKVRSLRDSLSSEEGLAEESLIVIGNLQSPGIVILTDLTLRLVPIVGE